MKPIHVGLDPKHGKFLISCAFVDNGRAAALPSRRWDKKNRHWVAPVVRQNVEIIRTWRDALYTPEARALVDTYETNLVKIRRYVDFPKDFKYYTKPRPIQAEAVQYLYRTNVNMLVARVGAGKTKIWLDLTTARRVAGHTNAGVIVLPLSIRESFAEQIMTHVQGAHERHIFMPKSPDLTKLDRWLDWIQDDPNNPKSWRFPWLVIGIESLSQGNMFNLVRHFLLNFKRASMVVDESHYIKTADSARTEKTTTLGSLCDFRMTMTATPISLGVTDLYSQYNYLDPAIIGMDSYYNFKGRYCVIEKWAVGKGKNAPMSEEIIGYQNMDEFFALVKPYTFEIDNNAAGLNLPPVTYLTRRVDIGGEQKRTYLEIKKLMTTEGLTVRTTLERMLRLQQITGGFLPQEVEGGKKEWTYEPFAVNPKLRELRDVIEGTAQPMVIWACFRAEIAAIVKLCEEYGPTVEYHGGVDEAQREVNKTAYREGRARFFVSNPGVGGAGINGLQEVDSLMVFFSRDFHYIRYVQAIGRVDRGGRPEALKDKPLTAIDIIARGTIDEMILEAHAAKQDVDEYVRLMLKDHDMEDLHL